MPFAQGPRSTIVILLIGIAIGAVLTVVAGIVLALLRPEPASVLRPWWR
jgi:ABC-type enterochelin transport system permease subunit